MADTTELAETAMDEALANARQQAERIAGDLGLQWARFKQWLKVAQCFPRFPILEKKPGLAGGCVYLRRPV